MLGHLSGRLLLQREAYKVCLLYTSDAADERSSVDLGGRRIIKKKNQDTWQRTTTYKYKWYYNTY